MREGSNFVGTDWWPAGSSAYAYSGQSQTFYYTAAAIPNTRNVQISWWMTTESNDRAGSPTYFLCYNQQRLVVNGREVLNWTGTNPTYTSSRGTVWRGFTDSGSWLDRNYNKGEFFDTNGDYTGIRRWVQILGTRWISGSFTLTADANGTVQFPVYGYFGWYGKTGLIFSKTITIQGLISKQTYTVSFAGNGGSFVKGNSISNLPKPLVKTYGVPIPHLAYSAPTSADANGNENYKFNKWIIYPKDSFSYSTKSVGWTLSESYSRNESNVMNAIWYPVTKTITYDLAGGISSIPTSVSKPYAESIILPKTSDVTRYGCTLKNWQGTTTTTAPGGSYKILGNDTLKAIYAGNKYNIILKDIKGNTLRTLSGTYNSVLTGNFTYDELGYKCLGWSPYALPVRTVDDTPLPIVDNLSFDTNKSNYKTAIYIGNGNYTTTSPFKINSDTTRLHMIGEDIILYPILEYFTSFYIYTEQGWKLALPYVYNETINWKESLGYIFDNNSWKK